MHTIILGHYNVVYVVADMPCEGECTYGCAVIDGEQECFCPAGFTLEGTDCIGM